MDDTIESLRHQRNLLAEALGNVLVHYGVIRRDAALTGPLLLMAAETACEPHNTHPTSDNRRCGT
jgi:hypothetical protein